MRFTRTFQAALTSSDARPARSHGVLALLASALSACASVPTPAPVVSSAGAGSSPGGEVTQSHGEARPAQTSAPRLESNWPDGEPSTDLQRTANDLILRTQGWLATPEGRRELCPPSATPDDMQRAQAATRDLTARFFPHLKRSLQDAEGADPVLHALLDASRSLMSVPTPAVDGVAQGLMWVEADSYRRMVCQPGAKIPQIAAAFFAMVNERTHLLGILEAWVSAPITAPPQPVGYWTQRSDLGQIADRTLTTLSATGPEVDDHNTAVMAQATVTGAPFTCDAGAVHRFDLGNPGGGNHVLESGELLGLRLRCRNIGSSAEVGKPFHAALRLGGGWSPSARNRLMPSSLRMGLAVMNRSLRRRWS